MNDKHSLRSPFPWGGPGLLYQIGQGYLEAQGSAINTCSELRGKGSPEKRPRKAWWGIDIWNGCWRMGRRLHKQRWEQGSSSDSLSFMWENTSPASTSQVRSHSGSCPSQKIRQSFFTSNRCSCMPSTRHDPADAAALTVLLERTWERGAARQALPLSFFFFLFRAAPVACGSPQAKGWIGAASATYATAYVNARS